MKYCELKGCRAPSADTYGRARLCQVTGNFFGGLSAEICRYTDDDSMDLGDNGIYIIEGWKIIERIPPYDEFVEQNEHDSDEMLRAFDKSMSKTSVWEASWMPRRSPPQSSKSETGSG